MLFAVAAFLTVRAVPSLAVESVEDLIANNIPACIRTNDPFMPLFESILPLKLQYDIRPIDDLAPSLLNGSCAAAIVPRVNYEVWKAATPDNCRLRLTSHGSIILTTAGWITNIHSAAWLHRLDEYLLQIIKKHRENAI